MDMSGELLVNLKTDRIKGGPEMTMTIIKHSLAIAGHRTSVSLEEDFWEGLKSIAAQRGLSISALVAEIDSERGDANLSSALRVFVLKAVRQEAVPESVHGA
jgi:predicted DNA-binding ribbon-helix-helix protein